MAVTKCLLWIAIAMFNSEYMMKIYVGQMTNKNVWRVTFSMFRLKNWNVHLEATNYH